MVSFTSTTASLGCKVELRMTNENVSAPCAITLGASSTITIAVASTLIRMQSHLILRQSLGLTRAVDNRSANPNPRRIE